MALYRVVRNLAIGDTEVIEAGIMDPLKMIKGKTLAILIERGAITEVAPPPLEVLPGWKIRSRKLKPFGITDALQFLEADKAQLAKQMKVTVETINSWQVEIEKWLKPQPNQG